MTSFLAAVPPVTVPGAPVADFSGTPLWLSALKVLLLFVYLMLQVVVVIWFERRFVGFMQQRPGPNRFGPFGLLQTLGDGFKLGWKETVLPKNADTFTFLLAPIIAMSCAMIAFAVIPLGGMVNMFGYQTPLQVTDTPVAVIVVLAAAGVGAYGFLLAGWSSGSTYPLLGGLRSTAQVISYEIGMGLALVAIFIFAGSMSTSSIVEAQRGMWFIIPAIFSFFIYIVCMVGETNRIPFDLAEGEGELVGGYHTEYSGMWFGMFFVGEYINMFTVSALASTLFLGGYTMPLGIPDHGYWGILWLTLKMWMFMWFFVWLRGTVPRTRYDQFMAFGWKFIIPVTIVWVLAVAYIRAAQLAFFGPNTFMWTMIVVGVFLLVALAAAWTWDSGQQRKAEARAHVAPPEIDPYEGGFPVPPMPGQRLIEPTERDRATASIGASTTTATTTAASTTTATTTVSTPSSDEHAPGLDAPEATTTDQEGNRG